MRIIINISRTVVIACVILVTIVACVKIEFDELPSSQKGQIELTTDWSQRSLGIPIPTSYVVEVGDTSFLFTEAINILPAMDAGKYKMYVYNNPNKVEINNHIATINTVDGIIADMPDYLFTSNIEVEVEDDKLKSYTAVMQQQIHDLTIELTIEDGDLEKIQSISAQLEGMASQFNMETGELAGRVAIQPAFTLVGDKLVAKFRTLGTVEEPQKFILKITYNDGRTQVVESDLSFLLANFNKTRQEVLTLKGIILNTPTELGSIDGIAINWDTQTGNIIIH